MYESIGEGLGCLIVICLAIAAIAGGLVVWLFPIFWNWIVPLIHAWSAP